MCIRDRVSVDPEIIELLSTAKEFYDLSGGEFDVTMGAVLKIWHTYREEGIALNNEGQLGKVPPLAELESAKACTGWDKVEIDEIAGTVYLNQSCACLLYTSLARRLSLVSVPVSVSTLPPRHLIAADDLIWIDVPSAYLQADVLCREEELVGSWTRLEGTIPAGSLFYREMVETPAAMADFSVTLLNEGQAVFPLTIAVSEISGQLMQPGQKLSLIHI